MKACIKRIDTVYILGIPYSMVRAPLADMLGVIENGKQRITIDDGIKEQQAKVTLCHEVMHGFLENLGYYDESNKENLVQSLGVAMYRFIVDNPDVIMDICKTEGE
jgi:hypothetical protein